MNQNFAYIDEASRTAVTAMLDRPVLSDKEKKSIRNKATKTIAGFDLHDTAEEEKLIEAQLEKHRDLVKSYSKDRDKAEVTLADKGITPLAIVPTKAWVKICNAAELIRLAPDAQGHVKLHAKFFDGYANLTEFNKFLKHHGHKGFIQGCFPKNEESTENYYPRTNSYFTAKLVLPPPPADIAQILLKAQGLSLKVAAVPEAISFDKSPSELWNGNKSMKNREAKAERDYQEWLRNDPIVYTEVGSASAIIAQFGDFPIEKEVVDNVLKNESQITEIAHMEETTLPTGGLSNQLLAAMYQNQPSNSVRDHILQIMQSQWPTSGSGN